MGKDRKTKFVFTGYELRKICPWRQREAHFKENVEQGEWTEVKLVQISRLCSVSHCIRWGEIYILSMQECLNVNVFFKISPMLSVVSNRCWKRFDSNPKRTYCCVCCFEQQTAHDKQSFWCHLLKIDSLVAPVPQSGHHTHLLNHVL